MGNEFAAIYAVDKEIPFSLHTPLARNWKENSGLV